MEGPSRGGTSSGGNQQWKGLAEDQTSTEWDRVEGTDRGVDRGGDGQQWRGPAVEWTSSGWEQSWRATVV